MIGKNWNVILFCLVAWTMMAMSARADVKVKDILVKPRWPWNGLVDITYSIECDEKDEEGNPKTNRFVTGCSAWHCSSFRFIGSNS